MTIFFLSLIENLAMETELEQEGSENAWRTADLRIRKTQVPFCSLLVRCLRSVLNIVLSVFVSLSFVFP